MCFTALCLITHKISLGKFQEGMYVYFLNIEVDQYVQENKIRSFGDVSHVLLCEINPAALLRFTPHTSQEMNFFLGDFSGLSDAYFHQVYSVIK
jgi:hypothetical protein